VQSGLHEVARAPAAGLVEAVAGVAREGGVHPLDDAVAVGNHHRVGGGVQRLAEQACRRLGAAALGRGQRQRDEVGGRDGEGLLVGQPLADRPDVLTAHDAFDPALDVKRRVHHRRDAERLEIRRGELAGP
jgi:hypothetical protein